jgi:ferredoxin
MTREQNAHVAVLLCTSLKRLGGGLDPQQLRDELHAKNSDIYVESVAGLANRFDEIRHAAQRSGCRRFVIGLSSSAFSTPSLQFEARKAGLDPAGIEVVNLGSVTAQVSPPAALQDHAIDRITAAIAKARAFGGSRPENLKPGIPSRMSRRSLLSLPVLEYTVIPSINAETCRAIDGCQQCVQSCPHRALTSDEGRIELSKSRCTSCGICASACPTDSIDLPGVTPAQMEAQLRSLVPPASAISKSRGILFLCEAGERALELLGRERDLNVDGNWFPVRVPCIGMLTPHWILAPIAQGATAVALLPCGDSCRSGQSCLAADRVAYSREVLSILGESEDRITTLPLEADGLAAALQLPPHVQRGPSYGNAHGSSLTSTGRASVFLSLADHAGNATHPSLTHPLSPFGIVDASNGCTLCGGCASTCPTDSLTLHESLDGITLSFDSTRCVACSQCIDICPEPDVLTLKRVTDFQRLAKARVVLHQDAYQLCESCGNPIASGAMSRRIAAMLGEEFSGTARIISRYCIDCRGTLAYPAFAG